MSDPTTEPSVEAEAATKTPAAEEPIADTAVVASLVRKKGELPWWVALLVVLVAGAVVYFVYQHLTADHITTLPNKKA